MGLIECASGASLWRGYAYYTDEKVKNLQEVDSTQYTAEVKGAGSEPYRVHIDLRHPRTSKCNCPHAEGKRIVCKHMVAVYFAAFPNEAQRIHDEAIAYEEEVEKRGDELADAVCQYVWKMKKSEAQEALLELLFDGPEWQLDKFISEHDLGDSYY